MSSNLSNPYILLHKVCRNLRNIHVSSPKGMHVRGVLEYKTNSWPFNHYLKWPQTCISTQTNYDPETNYSETNLAFAQPILMTFSTSLLDKLPIDQKITWTKMIRTYLSLAQIQVNDLDLIRSNLNTYQSFPIEPITYPNQMHICHLLLQTQMTSSSSLLIASSGGSPKPNGRVLVTTTETILPRLGASVNFPISKKKKKGWFWWSHGSLPKFLWNYHKNLARGKHK